MCKCIRPPRYADMAHSEIDGVRVNGFIVYMYLTRIQWGFGGADIHL